MAENELEARLNKEIVKLQAQINSLNAYVQRIHRQITHPSIMAKIKAGLGNIVGTTLRLTSIPIYASNAAAIAGGLTVGDVYRSGADPDVLRIVHA